MVTGVVFVLMVQQMDGRGGGWGEADHLGAAIRAIMIRNKTSGRQISRHQCLI